MEADVIVHDALVPEGVVAMGRRDAERLPVGKRKGCHSKSQAEINSLLVELARDAAVRLLPVSATDVSAMIDGLKLTKLLAGFRGRPPTDRAALETTVLALGRFFLDHRTKIRDIEINPLMVRPSGAVAVDVRVLWREEARGRPMAEETS